MDENKKSSSSVLLAGALGFILGTVFGLIVLGWWLFPVKWEDSRDNQLMPASQEDYLRAAIDSYSHNQDEMLAQQRYLNLGADAADVLNKIWQSPEGISIQEIQAYAVVVGATLPSLEQGAISTAAPPTQLAPTQTAESPYRWFSNRPLWVAFGLILCMAFFVFLVVIGIGVIRRTSKSRREKSSPTIQTFDTPDQAFGSQETVEIEDAQPGEIPDWLRDSSEQQPPEAESETREAVSTELSDEDFVELAHPEISEVEYGEAPAADQTAPPGELDWTEAEEVPSAAPVEEIQMAVIGEETQEQTYAKFSQDVQFLPDIRLEEANRLRDAGYQALLLLFKAGSTAEGRTQIAEQTGLEPAQILSWVNLIDLLRVKGLHLDHLQILKAVGVETVVELAERDPDSLHKKFSDFGETVSKAAPTLPEVSSWVDQAQHLPRIIR